MAGMSGLTGDQFAEMFDASTHFRFGNDGPEIWADQYFFVCAVGRACERAGVERCDPLLALGWVMDWVKTQDWTEIYVDRNLQLNGYEEVRAAVYARLDALHGGVVDFLAKKIIEVMAGTP